MNLLPPRDAHVSATEFCLAELSERLPALHGCLPSLRSAIAVITAAAEADQLVLTCGNGGSAADAEHLVGELVKGFRSTRLPGRTTLSALAELDPLWQNLAPRLQRGVRALALTTAGVAISAIANDQDAELIFAQQVLALARRGDVLIVLSTSGRSRNLVRAAQVARTQGALVVAFTGAAESPLGLAADIVIRAPADETHLVQECHLPLYHALCAAVEAELFSAAG